MEAPDLSLPDHERDPDERGPMDGNIADDKKSGEDAPRQSKLHHFKAWYLSHKKLAIPASILLFLLILFIIPWTRYEIAGLFLKNDFSVEVTDSTANTPVSGATVEIGSVAGTTDGSGKATLHGIKVGDQSLKITKKYYNQLNESVLVPILDQKSPAKYKFVATGRQVKIVTTNLINGQKISGANIQIQDTQAKTDKNGEAVVVVPADSTKIKATITAQGYNDSDVIVQVSDNEIKENDFKLTPAGKVYFLSKLSGTIDVVKTNLDGTDRQTVLAGTGKEDDSNTVLLASRDWNYLALLSSRDGQPKLYVINTNDDKLLTMDQGNATFTPVGWYNHYFVYTVARNGFNAWQPNAFSIKSYNADTGQPLTLANSGATGSSNSDAQYETLSSTLIMGGNVMFTRTWYAYPGYLQVTGKQNVLASIRPDGSNSKQVKSVDSDTAYISSLKLNKPNQLYFAVYSATSSDVTYYTADKNGNVSQNSSITQQDLYEEATSYLASPSGNQTFWSDERDGKNSLFVGDQDGNNSNQIASLSDYDTYGWYTDSYLLVSKNSSELYVIPVSGVKSDTSAIKISDYHKPKQTFYGYGGGYGGL